MYVINLTTILSNKSCILNWERKKHKIHQREKTYFLLTIGRLFVSNEYAKKAYDLTFKIPWKTSY